MPNTMIANPAAPVAAMNRPVMIKDIAEKLGKSAKCVSVYLSKSHKGMQTPTAILIRKTAEEMGYLPAEGKERVCVICGTSLTSRQKKYCTACGKQVQAQTKLDWSRNNADKMREYRLSWYRKNGHHGEKKNPETYYYWNGCFHSKKEEVRHMEELRAKGYSNAEIAKAIGRSKCTVIDNIGKQDPELSKQNRVMAAHIRAQKNAARKQYVLNRPILEYNAKVEEHNKLKAKVVQMEAELLPQAPAIEKAAQIKIDFPLVNLSTLKPTALQ